jgi:hypothetical protein
MPPDLIKGLDGQFPDGLTHTLQASDLFLQDSGQKTGQNRLTTYDGPFICVDHTGVRVFIFDSIKGKPPVTLVAVDIDWAEPVDTVFGGVRLITPSIQADVPVRVIGHHIGTPELDIDGRTAVGQSLPFKPSVITQLPTLSAP